MKTIKITPKYHMPNGHFAQSGELYAVRQALRVMKVGESFDYKNNKTPYRAAEQLGFAVTIRKLNGTGFRVWRKR